VKVTLISHTQNALELLLGTKSTRMRGADPATMTEEEKQYHWKYMLDTIKSPFEFVDFIFEIEGVSKNFTHQFVRTHTGAYQQETSRALDMADNPVIKPENFEEGSELERLFYDAVADAACSYEKLVAAGAQLQDARAIIPSNMATKIKAKFNLRTLSDMAKTRLCARTQGEYQDVLREMVRLVREVYPWTDPLLQVACVATGQCAFPRWGSEVTGRERNVMGSGYTETYRCKFYRPWMNLEKQKEELRQVFWSESKEQANPVAKNGVSM